jgi:hypothetical protein
LESAAVVVTRRGRTPLLAPPPCGGARFPTLAALYCIALIFSIAKYKLW